MVKTGPRVHACGASSPSGGSSGERSVALCLAARWRAGAAWRLATREVELPNPAEYAVERARTMDQ